MENLAGKYPISTYVGSSGDERVEISIRFYLERSTFQSQLAFGLFYGAHLYLYECGCTLQSVVGRQLHLRPSPVNMIALIAI